MKIDNHLASDTPPARILLLEDSYIDAAFIKNDLEMSGLRFDLTRAQNRLEFLAALTYSYDLILCDYYLDHFNAEQALAILRERGIDTPVVLITNADEQKVLALVEQGASDFLQKDRLGRLAHSVKGNWPYTANAAWRLDNRKRSSPNPILRHRCPASWPR